jgi:uncharacterized protein YqgC (DUF456 family)
VTGSATNVIVAAAMAIGLVGTLVPLLPGLLLILGAAIAYGVLEGFGTVGAIAMLVIATFFVVGSVVSIVMARRSAARGGAPRSSLFAAAAGGVVGMFVLPILGFVVGAVAGILLAERARLREWNAAWRVTWTAVKGYALGMLVEAFCGASMFATWAVWALLD